MEDLKVKLLHDYYAQYYGVVWKAGTILYGDYQQGYYNPGDLPTQRTYIRKDFVESHQDLFGPVSPTSDTVEGLNEEDLELIDAVLQDVGAGKTETGKKVQLMLSNITNKGN